MITQQHAPDETRRVAHQPQYTYQGEQASEITIAILKELAEAKQIEGNCAIQVAGNEIIIDHLTHQTQVAMPPVEGQQQQYTTNEEVLIQNATLPMPVGINAEQIMTMQNEKPTIQMINRKDGTFYVLTYGGTAPFVLIIKQEEIVQAEPVTDEQGIPSGTQE